ncbi:MAG: DUF1259 domain-containing protein [Thermoanaerobaculia bacterium]
MKPFRVMAGALLLLAPCAGMPAADPPGGSWESVDRVLGETGKDLPGNVHKFGWPRTDLRVTLAGITIEPALALGSWAAFQKTGNGEEAVVMGDLVLLGPEVPAVVGKLQAGGFEILAIHNHLIDETPRLLYVHFHGRGEAEAIAKTLKTALDKTNTPLRAAAAKTPVKLSPAQEKTFEKVQAALGRKGTMAGHVLQVTVPRAAPIEQDGMEVPPSMGMAIAMNFEYLGARVAATGDFVLAADEVNPVIRELRLHEIEVTALHSHMLREEPRLFFLHFWGVGGPEKIAEGLKAALATVATK